MYCNRKVKKGIPCWVAHWKLAVQFGEFHNEVTDFDNLQSLDLQNLWRLFLT